ncbi:uncharacterized protein HMPREF1541_03854 [Cyphellophora europaea CBS 101466]|uniref:Uncharacterized protein n=1 Tax=Cyphellophora europaea (strain CBS 101466) TaxID=1220924 RepID=W2S006_CYPE1|nr:uncharacterized protein HMPREF1541_03854 [Cyphellophora europaea CBS 101466]ETN41915.1 hypothetical protein HMPREF1541_03854 [Cyphellophora europaea CBS 101466]
MHAIGTSHNCFACIQADNQHHERHKKIAELKAEYVSLVEAEALASVKNKRSRGPALQERDVNAPINHDRDIQADDDVNLENDLADETTSNSAPSTTSSKPKATKAEVRAAKREAKEAKSRRKSLKNQSKHPVALRVADIDHIAFVLHGEQSTGESHPLATDKCIEDVMERNRRYVTSIAEHKALLLKEVGRTRRVEAERKRGLRKRKERDSFSYGSGEAYHGSALDDEQESLVNAVLIKLDIPVEATGDGTATANTPITPKRGSSGNKGNQEKAMVLAQLRIAIADDLVKHENEQRQTCVRAGGFWRYVGRQVFERMMDVAERIDWKTGEQKKGRKGVDAHDAGGGDGAAGHDAADNVGDDDDDAADGVRAAVGDVQDWVEDVAEGGGVNNVNA